MPGLITDLIDRVTDSTTGRPVVSSLAAPKTLAAPSITLTDVTNWSTTTALHFIIYEVTAAGIKDPTTETEWKGTLAGSTMALTITGGTDRAYSAGAIVELAPTARWAKDLYDLLSSAFNQDGTAKTTWLQAGLNQSGTAPAGWTTLATVPTVTSTDGNRSNGLQYASVNYTDRLSKGMRLLLPRTGTAVQTQVTSLNGTTQYWNDTTVAGMSETDDFARGTWIYVDAYPTSGVGVIMSRYNNTSGWLMHIDTYGRLVLQGNNGGSINFRNITSYRPVPQKRWVHIAGQLDMSAYTITPTTCYLMIDGEDVPSFLTTSGTNPTSIVQAGNLEIGSTNGGTSPFNGKIAQAWMTSAKVTQANIRGFMNAPITSSVISTNNIVSAFAFDGNGNDLNTTNANNLTANGSATATNAASPFNANAYAIIASDPVYSGGNTTMTVTTPVGYPIPNATLGTSSYSGLRAPQGMPAHKDAWSHLWMLIGNNTAMVTGSIAGAWSPFPNSNFTLPIGEWDFYGMHTVTASSSTASQYSLQVQIDSTTPTIGKEAQDSSRSDSPQQFMQRTYHYSTKYSVTSPTAYALYAAMSNGSGTQTAYLENGRTNVIRLDNALL